MSGDATSLTVSSPPPRGLFSAIAVSALLGLPGGLWWIGRWRAGLVAYIAMLAFAMLMLWRAYAGDAWTGLLGPFFVGSYYAWIGLAVLALLVVLPLRERSRPAHWLERGMPLVTALVLMMVVSLGTAWYIRTYVIQPFSTPSSSMDPTLREGDYFFVDKRAYANGQHPQRGDIVVFQHPTAPVLYVMRLVGLPGDKVQMQAGVLHLNGKPVDLKPAGVERQIDDQVVQVQVETLPDGAHYLLTNMRDGTFSDDTAEFNVPAGQMFVLGDNRDNSSDSRFEVGTVPLANVIGRASRIYWSVSDPDFRARAELVPERP